jgi:hypothetical protein
LNANSIKGHITAYTQYKLKKRSLGNNVNSISLAQEA